MQSDRHHAPTRRAVLAMAVALSLAGIRFAAAASGPPMKIGVIGAGRIGGTLGTLWVKAGHEVLFSSLDLAETRRLVAPLGPRARAGTPAEAAAFGEAVLVSVPYGAMPQIGRDHGAALAGKTVLDTGNPYEARDGAMATAALAKGAGMASAEFLPGARIVRAFTSVGAGALASEAGRAGERVAIPLAGDDAEALKIAARLVTDAGFDPVVVGPLASGRRFDRGTPVFGRAITARDLRRQLALPAPSSP
jgi:predicted dinucleotide-binding enzyme